MMLIGRRILFCAPPGRHGELTHTHDWTFRIRTWECRCELPSGSGITRGSGKSILLSARFRGRPRRFLFLLDPCFWPHSVLMYTFLKLTTRRAAALVASCGQRERWGEPLMRSSVHAARTPAASRAADTRQGAQNTVGEFCASWMKPDQNHLSSLSIEAQKCARDFGAPIVKPDENRPDRCRLRALAQR
jgi:hypothetical protein